MTNIFKIAGYILIGLIIGAAGMYLQSCKSDRPSARIFDSTDVANARQEGYNQAKAELWERRAIELQAELDLIKNKAPAIIQNNTQYKADYSKKTPSETDAEFLEWSKKHSQ